MHGPRFLAHRVSRSFLACGGTRRVTVADDVAAFHYVSMHPRISRGDDRPKHGIRWNLKRKTGLNPKVVRNEHVWKSGSAPVNQANSVSID